MDELSLIIGDYIKGKSIYPFARRILNLIFNISITSFLYEFIYGSYIWNDYDDYKKNLDFLIKGNFFIPLSIFIIVYGFTFIIPTFVFNLSNHFKRIEWTRKIIIYQIKNETIEERFRQINYSSKFVAPSRLTKSKIIELYSKLRSKIDPEVFATMENELIEPKAELEENFNFLFRALIAISIYFLSLPQFGIGLYILVSLVLLIILYLIVIAYRFLDVLPIMAKKLHSVAEAYLNEQASIDDSKSIIENSNLVSVDN